jgi:hypothetical protein
LCEQNAITGIRLLKSASTDSFADAPKVLPGQ